MVSQSSRLPALSNAVVNLKSVIYICILQAGLMLTWTIIILSNERIASSVSWASAKMQIADGCSASYRGAIASKRWICTARKRLCGYSSSFLYLNSPPSLSLKSSAAVPLSIRPESVAQW
jgi:hypothetical protein